jgi:hypothetical protein
MAKLAIAFQPVAQDTRLALRALQGRLHRSLGILAARSNLRGDDGGSKNH